MSNAFLNKSDLHLFLNEFMLDILNMLICYLYCTISQRDWFNNLLSSQKSNSETLTNFK